MNSTQEAGGEQEHRGCAEIRLQRAAGPRRERQQGERLQYAGEARAQLLAAAHRVAAEVDQNEQPRQLRGLEVDHAQAQPAARPVRRSRRRPAPAPGAAARAPTSISARPKRSHRSLRTANAVSVHRQTDQARTASCRLHERERVAEIALGERASRRRSPSPDRAAAAPAPRRRAPGRIVRRACACRARVLHRGARSWARGPALPRRTPHRGARSRETCRGWRRRARAARCRPAGPRARPVCTASGIVAGEFHVGQSLADRGRDVLCIAPDEHQRGVPCDRKRRRAARSPGPCRRRPQSRPAARAYRSPRRASRRRWCPSSR